MTATRRLKCKSLHVATRGAGEVHLILLLFPNNKEAPMKSQATLKLRLRQLANKNGRDIGTTCGLTLVHGR